MARGRRRASKGASAPAPQPLSSGGGVRARAARRRRRQRQRRTFGGVAALTALGLVVLVVVFFVGRSITGDDDDDGAGGRTQSTMLMQLRNADGTARWGMLLVRDSATQEASVVFVPSRVLVDAPALGSKPFAEALKLGGPKATRTALADVMQVLVDQDWTLDVLAFTTLIDRLGGVTVDVDVDVITPDGRGGGVIVVGAGGQQRLDGGRALAFASYVATGENELDSLPRLQKVLEGILAAATDAGQLGTTLSALGPRFQSSAPADRVADLLIGLKESRAADRLRFNTLPVIPIDTGGPRLTYRPDVVAIEDLVRRTLAGSLPDQRFQGTNRVILLNGVGTPGITSTAQ